MQSIFLKITERRITTADSYSFKISLRLLHWWSMEFFPYPKVYRMSSNSPWAAYFSLTGKLFPWNWNFLVPSSYVTEALTTPEPKLCFRFFHLDCNFAELEIDDTQSKLTSTITITASLPAFPIISKSKSTSKTNVIVAVGLKINF